MLLLVLRGISALTCCEAMAFLSFSFSACRLIEGKLNEVREQVKEMQRRNASKEQDLARMTGGSMSGKSVDEQLVEEKAALDAAQKKFDDWLVRNSRDSLALKLEKAAEDARRKSEELTSHFNNGAGGMTYNDYMAQYCEQRRLFHERSIKLARFKNFHETQRVN